MKYIVTEEQHRRLIESNDKLARMVQRVIDNIVDKIREECEESDDFSKFACRVLDVTVNIAVDDVHPEEHISLTNGDLLSPLYLTFNVLSEISEEKCIHFFYEYLQKPLEQRFGVKFVLRLNVNKIKEKQHNKLIESYDKLIPLVQSAIDKQLHSLWEKCENNYEEDDKFMCEMVDMIEKITVDHFEEKEKGNIYIYLIFDYLSHNEPEFGDFYYYYIKPRLKSLFGISFLLKYKGNQLIKPY